MMHIAEGSCSYS